VPGIVFDTNIWIAYRPTRFPSSLQMSVVVLQELIAGAPDSMSVAKYEALKKYYEGAGKLLVPLSFGVRRLVAAFASGPSVSISPSSLRSAGDSTADDWVLAGRVLNALLRGKKSKHRGKTPRLPDHEKQRIIRDVLIARSVKRIGATLVTNNLKDFNEIHRFCSLRIKSGDEFFFLKRSRRRDKLEACPTSAGSNNSNLTTHA